MRSSYRYLLALVFWLFEREADWRDDLNTELSLETKIAAVDLLLEYDNSTWLGAAAERIDKLIFFLFRLKSNTSSCYDRWRKRQAVWKGRETKEA